MHTGEFQAMKDWEELDAERRLVRRAVLGAELAKEHLAAARKVLEEAQEALRNAESIIRTHHQRLSLWGAPATSVR
jgi:hypothetical protein